ncbi:MAG: RNA polymerase-associated protein RapA [Legionellaceae bacterium]
MTKIPFTEKDLTENFAPTFLSQGKEYQQQGLVKNLQLLLSLNRITAEVIATETYQVEIVITYDEGLWIDGTCSCTIGFNCQHVTAVLWEVLINESLYTNTDSPHYNSPVKSNSTIQNPIGFEKIVYLLFPRNTQQSINLQVEPCVVKLLKNGSYSKPKSLPLDSQLPTCLQSIDDHLLKWLSFSDPQHLHAARAKIYPLTGTIGASLLQQLISTGRTHWITPNSSPLKLGNPRKGKLEWYMDANNVRRLQCPISGENNSLFLLNPLWYLDHSQHLCGIVETDIDPSIVYSVLTTPDLKPEQLQQLYTAYLSKDKQEKTLEEGLSLQFNKEKTVSLKPIIQLKLKLANVQVISNDSSAQSLFDMQLPVAELGFLYGNKIVYVDDNTSMVDVIQNDELIHYTRDFKTEDAALTELKNRNLIPLNYITQYKIVKKYPHYWVINEEFEQRKIVQFSLLQVPELRRKGWQIIIDGNYPYVVIEENETNWYSVIDEQQNKNWFDLELGIIINNERINILPLLIDLIEHYFTDLSPEAIQTIPPETKFLARLPDGRFLPVPIARIRTILQVLTELYDTESLSGTHRLRLSKVRAAQLTELEQAIENGRFKWFGGEQTRLLGERLKDFSGIKTVSLPMNFQADLRPYQQEGLNWLQFLREFGLCGILADDMGLGKTVQALAHILLEKQSGRMVLPTLVIAPTSLMMNWFMEAKRFAPDLNVLILHGINRKPFFDTLNQYDLILTTYPLLVRDKTMLLAQEYHLLILDEAQIIKNPKAKSAQIVQLISANHRLCLTGTPMENHLGELWSIFHFLMPGFLGKQEQFKKVYRNPIEKQGDSERRNILIKRIGPFLLRRTKQGVINELPSKSEIIRIVELESAQRDLYDSIRAALHTKISQAIESKGLVSSQIVILDALLKLRQTCCDPRLLKLSSAKRFNAGSAKLELLMDMLPNLIEEGRRILLFSQFTEMLSLIEQALHEKNIPYVILTGKTKDRTSVIEKFQQGHVPLFLISLKAGGTGLNLTSADTVIHYDPWWNPAVEAQATDRVYRIGQDKPVFVYKLLTADTVEEKILALQEKKRALIEEIYATNHSFNTITTHDLLNLFSDKGIN